MIRLVAKKSNFAGWINAFENDICLSINTQIFGNFQKKINIIIISKIITIMEIVPGVYETLISKAIEERLRSFPNNQYLVKKEDIDSADSYKILADYLAEVVANILKSHFSKKDREVTISNQVNVINRILKFIEEEWDTQHVETSPEQLSEESKLQFLRGIYNKVGYTQEQIEEKAKNHPVSGYRVSNLFTGGNDISMDDEVRRDIQTADSIDLIVSFIKFEGLRLLYDDLLHFVEREGTKLRILTTTYMGATDPKAIRKLYELRQYGQVSIRASYNTKQERLHAKSYIFHRNNGFDTAYIGSSNISRSALTKGLEWNIRVTSIENRHIISKTQATFDNYWSSADFEPIENEDALKRFENAIWKERNHEDSNNNEIEYITRFERKTHQIRAQSSFHGYPLLGDTAYKAKKQNMEREYFLHAYELCFPPNELALPPKITCPLSKDFGDLVLKTCDIKNFSL